MRAPDSHASSAASNLAEDVYPSGSAGAVSGGAPSLPAGDSISKIKKLLEAVAEPEVPVAFPAGVTRDILAAVMNLLATPVVLVDRHLSVVYANTAAAATLVSGYALSIATGQLHVPGDELTRLKRLIMAANRGDPVPPPLILDAPADSSKGGLKDASKAAVCVWVHPVDQLLQTSAPVWAQGLVVLIIKPVRAEVAVSASLLRSRYALTARQADVLAHLAAGATIEHTARALGVGVPTVRSHLAQCFAKTGTHRQPDLVALALSFASPILLRRPAHS